MSELMAGLKRSILCGEADTSHVGSEQTVMGWVHKKREMSKRIFLILRDRTGIVQVVCDEEDQQALYEKAKGIKGEYVVAVRGEVLARTKENVNPEMKTGAVEIKALELRVLSEAETPPFHVDEEGVNLDQRLKYRYIDLRRSVMQRNLELRHKAAAAVREFLNEEGFWEIETPMLTKSSPEGARDYLVPSRVNPGRFYALPQSPQLFKQILMVSGMEKYYQIVKCFRDEDLRADRQPEFTQIDMELSFVDADDVMSLNERLIQYVFKKTLGVEVQTPFLRMPYEEAMRRYGSDKPDIRFGMELVDLTQAVSGSSFGVFQSAIESGGCVQGINAKGCAAFPRKKIDALVDFVKTYRAKGMVWIAVQEDGTLKSQVSKFFSEEKLQEIAGIMDGKPGDLLLICADQKNIVLDALGNLRVELSKQLELTRHDDYQFLWVTEFPLLEYDEEAKRYVAIHHPFTSPMDEDLPLLESEPLKVRAKAYDMVLNGTELGGGSIRIHSGAIQETMFKLLGHSKEEAEERFGYLLDAFRYGVPPHGGLAFGFDRIIMLMTGADSIRDVIAFPKVKDASCPMTGAPDVVDAKQLEELQVSVMNKNLDKN